MILPEIKKVGMTGYLNCTVTHQLNNKVYWIHKDRQNIITSDNTVDVDEIYNELVDGYPKYDVRKHVRGDLTTYTLIIRRLQLTDAGTYTCQLNIKGDQENSPSKDGLMVVLSKTSFLCVRKYISRFSYQFLRRSFRAKRRRR